MTLTEKYRPHTLTEIVGQPWTVEQLQAFVANPQPSAFLFEGGTGTGKTSAAIALANDLGVDIASGPLGGFHEIASGEQTAESVRRVMQGLRLCTLNGSGWKVLVVNEADCMSPQAAYIWLDALENLPPRAVVVFTTNHANKLPARLRDRCECFRFESGYIALAPYLQELVAKVWRAETGRNDAPELDALGTLQDEAGNVSVRRVLQLITPLVRTATAATPSNSAAKEPWQMTRSEYRSWAVNHPSAEIRRSARRNNAETLGHPDAINLETVRCNAVRQAFLSGKPVPTEVLADYPDLSRPATVTSPRSNGMKIVNVRGTKPNNPDVLYTGKATRNGWKASPFGNQFMHDPQWARKYREWLRAKIARRDPATMAAIAKIDDNTKLGCWCVNMDAADVPADDRKKKCHCEVIVEVLREHKANPISERCEGPTESPVTPANAESPTQDGSRSTVDLNALAARLNNGEGIAMLAREAGVPWQTLHKQLREAGLLIVHRKVG